MSKTKTLLTCTSIILLTATANLASADSHTVRCVSEKSFGTASDWISEVTLVKYDDANEVFHIDSDAMKDFNGMPATAAIEENSSDRMVLTWTVPNASADNGHMHYRLTYFKGDGKYTTTASLDSDDPGLFDGNTRFGRCAEF